ncbi:MAG: DUF3179 domain-containing protein [Chloroflexi bacterium]|nr:DUF3179 domain-containing protein [Chloroflexota bacterium]
MYSRRVGDKVTEFGTSGMLYRSNKLMYDRATNTLWHQFLGVPAVGPLVGSGIKLKLIPSLVTTWQDWLESHPDTTVLSIDTGVYPRASYRPEGDPRSIYFDYRSDPETMFPAPHRSSLLRTKDQVLGLKLDGQSKAYPLDALLDQPVINDSLGAKNVVVVTSPGGAARAYRRGQYKFSSPETSAGAEGVPLLRDQQGREWQAGEEALVLAEDPSQRLERLPGHMAYWFGWFAFNPDTEVYSGVAPSP